MSAIFSPCGLFRYRLERELDQNGPTAAIIGVNPSTADAIVNDQTIKKEIGFGMQLGWGRIIKGNKFAFRATDVRELVTAADAIGPDNDAHLEQILRDADVHVTAWGTMSKLGSKHRPRWRRVLEIADKVGCQLMCFGVTKDGHPRHTLMLPYGLPLQPWVPAL